MEYIFIFLIVAALGGGFYFARLLARVERLERVLDALKSALDDLKPIVRLNEQYEKAMAEANHQPPKQRAWHPGDMKLSSLPEDEEELAE